MRGFSGRKTFGLEGLQTSNNFEIAVRLPWFFVGFSLAQKYRKGKGRGKEKVGISQASGGTKKKLPIFR
jgi:hypothetical protein